MEEWRDKVYHSNPDSKYWTIEGATPYWQEIRAAALKEDNYTCQRCGDREDLTIHHVIPRDLGGGDDLENLIALCTKCHDEVELLGFRAKWQIMNVFDNDLPATDDREITNDWRGWVYGAGKRPG